MICCLKNVRLKNTYFELIQKRTFNERKDRDVFCNGKMFDRKMFLIINNDKYITLNFSSICNMCNQLKSSYF